MVTGLVLGAGGSTRLGRPKQLLPYGSGTLLGHVVATARSVGFDQLVVVVGGSSSEVLSAIDFEGVDVVINEDYGDGCSSSIAAALSVVDERSEALVLLLGDQPGVSAETCRALIEGRGDADLAVCRYDDGRGHPFAFSQAAFDDLSRLHGDKGVWKLLDRAGDDVVEVRVPGPIPLDVDTQEDYERVLAAR